MRLLASLIIEPVAPSEPLTRDKQDERYAHEEVED